MNIVKAALRISSVRSILNPVRQIVVASPKNATTNLSTRPLWLMCSSSSGNNQMLTTKSHGLSCSCYIHQRVNSTAEGELLDYLNAEISARKNQPKELDGFMIEAKGSVLELSKELGNYERVKIYMNVNGTVDPVKYPPQDEDNKKGYNPTEFRIELIKGDQILDLTCSFMSIYGRYYYFQIEELTLYEGERKMETYAISITPPDTYAMRDLLMNILENMGICYEFAGKLYDLAIEHERNQYIGLLERMHKCLSTPCTISTSATDSIVVNGVGQIKKLNK